MRALICVMLAGVLVGGATFGAREAEADGRKYGKHRGGYYDRYDDDDRYDGRYRRGYFSVREVRVIREYYGPRFRHRGLRRRYYRSAYLPHGWHRRIEPYPVFIEREVIVLPHGYRRGIIDGHAVIHNSRGMIIDVAVLF